MRLLFVLATIGVASAAVHLIIGGSSALLTGISLGCALVIVALTARQTGD